MEQSLHWNNSKVAFVGLEHWAVVKICFSTISFARHKTRGDTLRLEGLLA